MGLFDKIKGAFKTAMDGLSGESEEERAKKEEEKRKEREEKKRQEEEKKRFNPEDKSLEWFGSEDGIKTFMEYITPQNYFLEETIKKEKENKYDDYSLDVVISVFHKEAKVPYTYFKNLVDKIEAQPLEYVGPIDMLVNVLSVQAKPFYLDEDGEPIARTTDFTPEEIVSVEKNPVLNYVSNFKCFELKDDNQGSWEDKWNLWSNIVIWLGVYAKDKDFISNNSWLFENSTYFNEMGTVRKAKGFYKKCLELAPDKGYFERRLNECE